MREATVQCRGRRKKDMEFLIRDMEHKVTQDKLKSCLATAVRENEKSVVVKGMRPAYSCTQNASVLVPEEFGRKLSKIPRVKTG